MKKQMFFMGLALMALVSCSKDEEMAVKQDAISFSVVADVTTRVGAVATTTNTIDEFQVWGYTGGVAYFSGAEVTGGNGNWKWDNTRFWPETAMNFYAFSPIGYGTVTPANDAFAIDCVADGETDMLYATKIGVSKPADSAAVPMNFRHGYAQLVFKAKNENENLGVQIGSVGVGQIYSSGKLVVSGANGNTEGESGNWGTWHNPGQLVTTPWTANVMGADMQVLAEESPVWLTNQNGAEGMYVLPQTVKPYDVKAGQNSTENNAYFVINCSAWNIPDEGTYTYLWGSAFTAADHGYKPVYIPVTTLTDGFEWKQGHKYVYTFDFTNGAGFDEDGDPVLVPINITVTVDEFIDAAENNMGIEMK